MVSWTGFFNTIILLGIVQGLIVSALLFFSKNNKRPTRILAALLLVITLASFNLYATYQNWFGSNLFRFIASFIPWVMVMSAGPLIYFYVQSSLNPDFKITKRYRRHFYPVLIDLVPSFIVFIYVGGVLTKLIRHNPAPWGAFIDTYNVYADIPRWLSITLYVGMSRRWLTAYKNTHHNSLNGQAINFKWLHQFIRLFVIFQLIWLVYLIPYVIPAYTDKMLDTFDWYPLYIPMAILIYWLGIKGYIISQQQANSQKKPGVNNSTLSPELIRQVIAALTKAMEINKEFLNPNLSLAILAENTGFAQKTISAVLNQHLHKSFNEFINRYRVDEFKERIQLPEANNLTIAGIAQGCGFNSQATFQRTFKELVGKSPSEFRKTTSETK